MSQAKQQEQAAIALSTQRVEAVSRVRWWLAGVYAPSTSGRPRQAKRFPEDKIVQFE